MKCLLITAILIASSWKQTFSATTMTEENQKDIEEIARILRKTVQPDLDELTTKHNMLVENAISVIDKSLEYVDKFTEDLKTHLEKRISAVDDNAQSNFELLEKNTGDMLTAFRDTMVTNLNNINIKSEEEHNDIIKWTHQRAHVHEDILKTRVTACAYDYGHFGAGVVTYDSKDGGYIEDSVSIRIYNKTDIRPEEVLNRESGVFTVPEHGAGEYLFTFTVTIDSFDQKLSPSAYFFMKNDVKIEGTKIYANVGFSKNHDRVPGSRTILLKLEENDKVSVTQELETDVQDYQISFCGALLHLEKASESPGGLFADASNPGNFPSGTEADQETWEYKKPEFAKTTIEDFAYESNKDAKETLVGSKTILEQAKIEELKAVTEKWDKTNGPWE